MERSLSMRMIRMWGIISLFGISAALTGCSFMQPSYFDAWDSTLQNNMAEEADFWHMSGVASDLCVIDEIAAYNDSTFQSEAVGVFNITKKETVYSKNPFETLRPASMTKLMTLYVALKYGDLEETVTFPEEAKITQEGVQTCNFQTGDTMTLKDLLYAMILYSGNDAAKAVALHFSDSADGVPTMTCFLNWMNEEAKNMGASSTYFKNPHGLDVEGHVSTVYDMYLILSHCIENETIREILETVIYEFDYTDQSGNEKHSKWTNTNQYVNGGYPSPDHMTVLGGKTGSSELAQYCLAAYAQDSEGDYYIAVVMKAPDRATKYAEMSWLFQMAWEAKQ